MWFFTPTQFLKPSQWLVAIPLVREEVLVLILKSDFSMKSAQDLVDWSKLLLSIMKKEKQLQELIFLDYSELCYPIKVPSRIFERLEQLLLIAEGKMIPLSEEQLRQVRTVPSL
jgi:hypothetical protein